MKTFAQQLCEARSKKGLTQEALAEALHVSRSTISHWEHARALPDVETVKRIAQVLDVDFWADDDLQQKQAKSADSIQQDDAIPGTVKTPPPPAKFSFSDCRLAFSLACS